MNKLVFLVPCAMLATGCHSTYFDYSSTQIGQTPMLVTDAKVRLVQDRVVPDGRHVVCTEPSPDVASAFDSATQISANVAGKASGSFDQQSAEQLAQLTARLPSIQALRDAVYRACEAYANGVLGANAYAMMVSRYGEILVTLMLGENAAGNFGKDLVVLQGLGMSAQASPKTPSSNNASSQTNGPAGPKASTDAAGSTGAGPYLVAAVTQVAAAPPSPPGVVVRQHSPAGAPSAGNNAPTAPPVGPAAAASSAGGVAGGHAKTPGAKGAATAKKTTAAANAKTGAGNGQVANSAQELEAMQKNYMTLTSIAPLMVTCANIMDDSRWVTAHNHDQFWSVFCIKLMDDLEAAETTHLKALYAIQEAAAKRAGK